MPVLPGIGKMSGTGTRREIAVLVEKEVEVLKKVFEKAQEKLGKEAREEDFETLLSIVKEVLFLGTVITLIVSEQEPGIGIGIEDGMLTLVELEG